MKTIINSRITQTQRRPSWRNRTIVPVNNVIKVKVDEEQGGSGEGSVTVNKGGSVRRKISSSGTEDDLVKSDEELISKFTPASSRSYILDLSTVTWIDRSGCSLLEWISREVSLSALVLPLHLEVSQNLLLV